MKKRIMTWCVLISMFLLGACAMGQDKSAAGVLQENDSGFSTGGSGDMAADESGQQNGQADSPQQSAAAGEETLSQQENEQQPENTSEIVFFGSWQVTDYRASRIYALSQEEIKEFLTYGVAYYEDAFFLNGTPVEAEDMGYVSMDYTKEEVEEQFNIDMTDWWNEGDTIAYIGIISAESDESPSLRYCFGTEFFVIDSDTIWIYYEGVFFRAERAGA